MTLKPLLAFSAALAAAAGAAQAPAPPEEQPKPSEGFTLGTRADRFERMTVPVTIDGQGPYRFIVDTGAERTVISRELAETLQLDPGATARVHSMSEVSDIPTVRIPALQVGGRKVRGIQAPALSGANIGAQGILGVDTLQSQRVSFDFPRQQMTVTPSRKREENWGKDTIVVTARSRFGHLVLVDARVDGQKVWVILDTGAQASVANSVLRQKLERKGRLGPLWPVEMMSVTGGRIWAEQTVVKKIELGGVDISDMPVAFADVHPFRKLKLTDRPAILLGMDALRLFERVSVDFANRQVRLLPPSRSEGPTPTRFAAR